VGVWVASASKRHKEYLNKHLLFFERSLVQLRRDSFGFYQYVDPPKKDYSFNFKDPEIDSEGATEAGTEVRFRQLPSCSLDVVVTGWDWEAARFQDALVKTEPIVREQTTLSETLLKVTSYFEKTRKALSKEAVIEKETMLDKLKRSGEEFEL